MKERVFAMDLVPNGHSSTVLMDGEDISSLLRGVAVRSDVDGGTTVELQPSKGCRAELIAKLPEANVSIEDDGDRFMLVQKWLEHSEGCPLRIFDSGQCTCGLNTALNSLRLGKSHE